MYCEGTLEIAGARAGQPGRGSARRDANRRQTDSRQTAGAGGNAHNGLGDILLFGSHGGGGIAGAGVRHSRGRELRESEIAGLRETARLASRAGICGSVTGATRGASPVPADDRPTTATSPRDFPPQTNPQSLSRPGPRCLQHIILSDRSMDAYPPELVAHEAPLLLVSGLGAPEQHADADETYSYPQLAENGTRVASAVPPVTTPAGALLLEHFLKADSGGVWTGRPSAEKQKTPAPAWRIRAVGRVCRRSECGCGPR